MAKKKETKNKAVKEIGEWLSDHKDEITEFGTKALDKIKEKKSDKKD